MRPPCPLLIFVTSTIFTPVGDVLPPLVEIVSVEISLRCNTTVDADEGETRILGATKEVTDLVASWQPSTKSDALARGNCIKVGGVTQVRR
mmetsp:Transcript_13175/g.16787  ORF Transcript_13175/g.16787 Transcript_13175/m.16787 type:complete len:91 (-) Transcript_13175:46-318(-)